MEYKTYGEMKNKILKELDIEDEDFVQSAELLGYFNDGINEAEAEIITIYEDYFLTRSTISLVNGTSEYTLPSNMYASKIRVVMYVNGTKIYEVERLKNKKDLMLRELMLAYPSNENYRYLIFNDNGDVNPKLLLAPAAYETLANGLVVWFLRNANKMVDDDSICDIPEFASFVEQYVRVQVMNKEGHPGADMQALRLEKMRINMIDTLSNMVPDEKTQVEMDLSHYDESS